MQWWQMTDVVIYLKDDQWFQKVCRNVALETWEKYDADPENRTAVNKVKRDDGTTEVS